jgi:hypothetical protein
METHEADLIQAGWKAYARDGSEAGTVTEVTADGLTIQAGEEGSEAVKVPMNLVVEAHAGRVELDMGPESFGGSTGSDSAGPARDPGSPPDVITPEQMRRFTGG